MIAALATLAFLAAAWLAIVAFAKTLDENRSRIAAAIGGQLSQGPIRSPDLRISRRYTARRPEVMARLALRVAA